MSYADSAYAATYFLTRFNTSAWDGATAGDRTKALAEATRAIDRLNFVGDATVEGQANQFPRGGDTTVPTDIKDACCELALSLLDDVDPDLEIENLGTSKAAIGAANVARDVRVVGEHIVAGIPSIRAWTLLKPYLREPGDLRLERG